MVDPGQLTYKPISHGEQLSLRWCCVDMLRLIAPFLTAALFATACAPSESVSEAAPDRASQSEPSPGAEPSTGSEGDDNNEAYELVSTTETDDPFDRDGGATTSNDGVRNFDSIEDLPGEVFNSSRNWTTDWTRRTIDVTEMRAGLHSSDPRDGIPPIDVPQFQPISTADWLSDNDPGALVQLNGEARFYPLSILTAHEIVNDRFGDVPVAVTFCPLCNTAITFDRRVDGEVLRLGVSGLLRHSDLVMWDDKTDSLWQQLTGEGIIGTYAGTQLEVIPTAIVSYSDARTGFPNALSLAPESGRGRYGSNPYVGYSSLSRPFLYDGETDDRFPALSRVVGLSVNDDAKAYHFTTLAKTRAVNDTVGDTPVVVWWGGNAADALDASSIADSQVIGSGLVFDRRVDGQTLTFAPADNDQFVDEETGTTWSLLGQAVAGPLEGLHLTPVAHRNEFWFAWNAFFPDADVYDS